MSNARPQPTSGKGRAPAQWTLWEILLIMVSLLLIIVPLFIELQQWAAPPPLPAREILRQERPTTDPATDTPVGPTDTPGPVGPTDTPGGNPPPDTPIAPPTDTPAGAGILSVSKNSTIAQGVQGQEFQFTIAVNYTGAKPQSVNLQDVINPFLELLDATTSSGSCTPGQTVVCSFSVSQGAPVYVVLTVRIRPDVPHATTISNRASANGVPSNLVSVTVVGDPVPLTPTPIPTDTPINIPPTDTPVPLPPTSTPVVSPPPQPPFQTITTPLIPSPGQPTPGPNPTRRSGDERGSGGAPRATKEVVEQHVTPPVPPPPPPLVVEPTIPPPPPPPPQRPAVPRQPQAVRPTAVVVQPTVIPPTFTESPPSPTPTDTELPTATPTPLPPTPIDSGIAFRMLSDWGSAFPGQDVVYTIILQNNQATTLRNVVIGSTLPANLTVKGAAASRGDDPTVTANEVRYHTDSLAEGEMVQLMVQTTVKPNVVGGTRMVAQSQLSYDGAPPSFFSNVVTVMVVDNEERIAAAPITSPYPRAEWIARATAMATGTSTMVLTATTIPTTTDTPQGMSMALPTLTPASAIATVAETVRIAATATVETPGMNRTITATTKLAMLPQPAPTSIEAAPVADQTNTTSAPLPATSTGLPLAGGVLLGVTLMIRTVRLHRARERM